MMMVFAKVAILFIYVTLSVFGLYKLKASEFGLNADFIIGFFCYGLGFLVWMLVLKLYPLSLAFPLAAGLLMIGTQLVGYYLLNEHVQPMQLVGVSSVIIGLSLISLSNVSDI